MTAATLASLPLLVPRNLAPPVLSLRRLRLEDIPAIGVIQASEYSEDLHEREDVFREAIAHYPAGNFVVEVGGIVAGYCFSHPHDIGVYQCLDRGMKLSGRENGYYLHDLAIWRRFQGMGLAKILFEAVLHHALDEGYPTIALVSVQKTWRFWQQKGFQVIKRMDYGGRKAYFMERLITH